VNDSQASTHAIWFSSPRRLAIAVGATPQLSAVRALCGKTLAGICSDSYPRPATAKAKKKIPGKCPAVSAVRHGFDELLATERCSHNYLLSALPLLRSGRTAISGCIDSSSVRYQNASKAEAPRRGWLYQDAGSRH
jgi:hypothetical protein